MINTFHSSFNPPPVPPRAGYSKPQPAGNTPLVKFLSVMMLLLMILTFGGFLYLFHKLNMQLEGKYQEDMTILQRLQDCEEGSLGEDAMLDCKKIFEKYKFIITKVSQDQGKVAKIIGHQSFNAPVAHMVLLNEQSSNYKKLNWNAGQSLLQGVRLSSSGETLIIQSTGTYFIYSQVTFSKQSVSSLKHAIWSIEPTTSNKEEKEILKSYCSLNPQKSEMCTASLSGVFLLNKDQQLYVRVTNTSLVNRESCSFGLFKLQ